MRHQLGLQRHSTHCYTHGTDTGLDGAAWPATALPPWLPMPAASSYPGHQVLPLDSAAVGAWRGFWCVARNRGCCSTLLQYLVSRDGSFLEPCTPCPRLQALDALLGLLPRLKSHCQGASRRQRASTAPLGPWATPPMTKSRSGAGQLEQEQRPVGMGGSSSHLFRVRLNPSTESSGHDWFPARDGMASALSVHPGFCCTEVTMQGFSRINSIPWERAAGNNAAPWCCPWLALWHLKCGQSPRGWGAAAALGALSTVFLLLSSSADLSPALLGAGCNAAALCRWSPGRTGFHALSAHSPPQPQQSALPRPPMATTYLPRQPATKSALFSLMRMARLGLLHAPARKRLSASPWTSQHRQHSFPIWASPCAGSNISTVLTKCGRE